MTAHRILSRGDLIDELIATVAILRADAVSPSKLCGLLEYVGSAVDLLPPAVGGAEIEGSPMFLHVLSAGVLADAEREVRDWHADGLEARTILHPGYPENLQAVFDKPPFLFLRGHWDDAIDNRALAIVGTRSATADGCKRAYRLAKSLAGMGITIISGLAKGIDSYAHQGALAGGGRTVAVLGTGITRIYPAENGTLADEILANEGALVSQFFPAQPPTRWTFPVRNRTMSGLALATIVVEAGATSGAKMQAEAALIHGRPVFLPTSLVEAHAWARSMVTRRSAPRAIQVASAEDVLDHLNLSAEADALVA